MTLPERREALLACPFCGGEGRTLPALRRVFCVTPDCGAEMVATTQAGAIMLWNTRSQTPGGEGE